MPRSNSPSESSATAHVSGPLAGEHHLDPRIEYRQLPQFEGYRIGSDGTVWTEWRVKIHNGKPLQYRSGTWRRLKGSRDERGRHFVRLRYETGKYKKRPVHHLVLEAFHGPRPEGMEGCHGDGDCANNRAENLRWDTHSSNLLDRRRHGTATLGSIHPNSKLTEADVITIRQVAASGVTEKVLAAKFGTAPSNVHNIIRRETWRHVA